MKVWRYKAVPSGGATRGIVRGERSGATASEVRSALHAAGLRVLDIRPLRQRAGSDAGPSVLGAVRRSIDRHLRSRRGARKSELFDALATMLDAGLPLVEAIGSIAESGESASTQRMLRQITEDLRGGKSFAETMASNPAWFDDSECAMVRAGQQGGDLAGVVRTLSERHGRAGELSNRLTGALAYPAIVAAVGVGVVIFLSTKTLPELASVLTDAGQDVPALTAAVMSIGRGLVAVLPWLGLGVLLAGPAAIASVLIADRLGFGRPRWPSALTPKVARRSSLAGALMGLAELLRTGVPAVEALRVLAPTAGGLITARLGQLLNSAAGRIERGESFADALDDPIWFPDEVRRLIRVGEQSGELESVLDRLGHRYKRSAERLIDRLAALLEPAVILVLAVGVGIVVMAAVLPLTRLQSVL